MPEATGQFSVVIPTLQRAPELWPLVELCAEHALVHEVIVINNSPEPLAWESPKVRVLQQDQNIYVNPAWNLGVRVASGEYLAIINDDVLFDAEAFDYVATLLERRWVGLVGTDAAFFNRGPEPLRWRVASHANVTRGYGMFMAMKRANYVPIPDDILIWGGDDWLFFQSPGLNLSLLGGNFQSVISATSAAPEFSQMRLRDYDRANAHIGAIRFKHWWHRPVERFGWLRRQRGRLRASFSNRTSR